MFISRRSILPAALSDEELLRRYRIDGDVADLGVLYDRYLTEVFVTCRRYLRPDEDAEDAVMQLFEHLVVKLRRYEVSNFPAWLYATARNYCLTVLRARQRAGPAAGGTLVVHFSAESGMESTVAAHLVEDDDADMLLTEERLQALEHALAELPSEQRCCLELFFLDKKSYRDIADETGFDLKQVKSYLQNGKRSLKRYLESAAPFTATPHARR